MAGTRLWILISAHCIKENSYPHPTRHHVRKYGALLSAALLDDYCGYLTSYAVLRVTCSQELTRKFPCVKLVVLSVSYLTLVTIRSDVGGIGVAGIFSGDGGSGQKNLLRTFFTPVRCICTYSHVEVQRFCFMVKSKGFL
jgi:hypothetical protein